MISNARARQSVALSAVLAMIGWLLVVERGHSSDQLLAHNSVPSSQALQLAPSSSTPVAVQLGQPLKRSLGEDEWAYFVVQTPAEAGALKVRLSPTRGDVDLYLRQEELPEGDRASGGLFDASSAGQGASVEEVRLIDSAGQRWYIGVHGYRDSEFELHAHTD